MRITMSTLAGSFGVSSFFAEANHNEIALDVGGRNGSWSTSVIGKFQGLVPLRHPNICCYIDIVKNKHERLIVVAEYYSKNLTDDTLRASLQNDVNMVMKLLSDCCHGLEYLNQNDMVHGCLSPDLIVYDEHSSVFKLVEFGRLYLTEFGANAAASKFRQASYLAPEILILGPDVHGMRLQDAILPSSDVWSLGVIVLELLHVLDFKQIGVKDWIRLLFESAIQAGPNGAESRNFVDVLISKCGSSLKNTPEELNEILLACCSIFPDKRASPALILQKITVRQSLPEHMVPGTCDPLWGVFPSVSLRCQVWDSISSREIEYEALKKTPVFCRGIDEIYRLWRLGGGDLLTELKAHGFAKEEPPVLTLPIVSSGEVILFGAGQQRISDPVGTLLTLDLMPLLEKLEDIPKEIYFPLLLRNDDCAELLGDFIDEMLSLPLIIRENNLQYQLYRQILFHRLLSCYPFTASMIRKEAVIDVPPLYRSRVWAALLDIKGDVNERYESIDKFSYGPSDRQIEVDIPRCHQYNSLMASAEAHGKLKRILKAWIVEHDQFVYWQGLDSLSAPFVYLNFSDEPLAYACLSAFVEKYVYKFFLKDNTPVIQEYLAVFSHLLAFHEPVLSTHLTGIGFLPELYSIPWFLTMFTHVFPLHKVFHLWDKLLLGDESFPLFVGLSLLSQLRSRLLTYGFNECILLFSDFPDLDIQQTLSLASEMFLLTPKSAMYRVHGRIVGGENILHVDNGNDNLGPDGSYDLDLELLKSEVSPRITWEEVQWLDSQHNTKSPRTTKQTLLPLMIDTRTSEEFVRGSLPHSINVPFLNAFGADGTLLPSFEANTLQDRRGQLVVVFDGKCVYAPKFAAELVRLGFPYVSILHFGIDHLKTSGFITVPASY